jgi:hypothetical protein
VFGLYSTIDPRLEEQFQQYYKLLGIPENELTADQRGTRERLARELRPHRALGFTRRDQAMYDFIDEYLAKELRTSGAVERRRLKAQTMQKLREIWAEVDVDRLSR